MGGGVPDGSERTGRRSCRVPVRAVRTWLHDLRLAPDGSARPDAPFGRGPLAAHVLAAVIDGSVWLGCRLPAWLAHALATIGGHGEWAVRRSKRRRLAANLAHALAAGERDRAVRRVVRQEIVNEAHRSADLLWALGRPQRFLDTVQLHGIERAQAAADGGNGVILAGLHLGGWEVATAVPRATLSVPTTVVVADDWLAWAIAHMRATAGLRVMYRTASAVRAARLLRRGEALLMLGDDGSGKKPRTYRVRFLDSWADLPAGLVTLSRLSRAPIVTFAVVPIGRRRWRVIVDEPVGPPPEGSREDGERDLLQRVADRWSAMVRSYPEHWAASYRIRWLEPEAQSASGASES